MGKQEAPHQSSESGTRHKRRDYFDKNIDLELSTPHHPFLDEIRPLFPNYQFYRFLQITKERFGTLDVGSDNPIMDPDVKAYTDSVLSQAAESLPPEDVQEIKAAAYFSIWAHGINPSIGKRFRHEKKPGTNEKWPYAIHLARVAQRVIDKKKPVLKLAWLHDVPEDTVYTLEDVGRIFDDKTARLVGKATKISTDQLENIQNTDDIEVKVIEKFLTFFRQDSQANAARKVIKEQSFSSSYEMTLSEFERATFNRMKKAVDIRGIFEQLSKGKENTELITLIRLFSGIENEDDIPVLIVKCADVADNSSSYEVLAQAKGQGRAFTKAKLAEKYFLPLSQVLGLDAISSEIEANVYKTLYPDKLQKVQKKLSKRGYLEKDGLHQYEASLKGFKDAFILWVNERNINQVSPDTIQLTSLSPTPYDVVKYGLKLGTHLPPILHIKIEDEVTLETFYRFLTRRADDFRYKEVEIPPHLSQFTHERVKSGPIKVFFRRNYNTIFCHIKRSFGTIADIFSQNASERQVNYGRDQLAVLQKSYKDGDFSDFLELAGSKSIFVRLQTEKGAHFRHPFLILTPGATFSDAIMLSNEYDRDVYVLRGGRKIAKPYYLQKGDVLVFGKEPPYLKPSYMDYHAYDELTMPAAIDAARRLIEDPLNKSKETLPQVALERGWNIFARLTDAYITQVRYAGDSALMRGVSDWTFDEELFRNLFFHREHFKEVVDNVFLQNLGTTPQPFPKVVGEFTLPKYHIWMKDKTLQYLTKDFASWMKTNCYYLFPHSFQRDEPQQTTLSRYASILQRLTEGVTVYKVKYTHPMSSEERIFYDAQPVRYQYIPRLHETVLDHRSFNPCRGVITLPFSGNGYPDNFKRVSVIVDHTEIEKVKQFTADSQRYEKNHDLKFLFDSEVHEVFDFELSS